MLLFDESKSVGSNARFLDIALIPLKPLEHLPERGLVAQSGQTGVGGGDLFRAHKVLDRDRRNVVTPDEGLAGIPRTQTGIAGPGDLYTKEGRPAGVPLKPLHQRFRAAVAGGGANF